MIAIKLKHVVEDKDRHGNINAIIFVARGNQRFGFVEFHVLTNLWRLIGQLWLMLNNTTTQYANSCRFSWLCLPELLCQSDVQGARSKHATSTELFPRLNL